MSNVDVLRHSIAHTHENLENRLQRARAMAHAPDQPPRQALEVLDGFLAMASKHLGAVDAACWSRRARAGADGATGWSTTTCTPSGSSSWRWRT